MDLPTPDQTGLDQSHAEFLDLAAMPPIRQRTSPADLAMNAAQAAAFVAGQLPAPGVEGPPGAPPPAPLPPPPAAPPTVPPAPLATTAIPNPNGPDIRPQDADSVKRRIGKLYGQWKTEQERAADLEGRLQRAEAALTAIQSPPRPFSNQYAQFPPAPAFAPAPATPGVSSEASPGQPSDYVSRTELLAALRAHSELIAEQNRNASAQATARREAEADFPDVFSDPDLKEAADRIYASDPFLKADPNGPYKAAAMARGLRDPFGAPAGGPAPTAERKAQVAGIGISIPQGAPQPPNDRETRYRAALAYAIRTGRLSDYARARRIQMGAEG